MRPLKNVQFCSSFTIVLGLLGIIMLPGCAGQQDVLILDSRLAVIEERSAATEQQCDRGA